MKIIIPTIFLFISLSACSQDYIYKLDSSRIAAKVLKVEPGRIRYRLFNNADTTIYSISKEALVLIVYGNGTYDMFQQKKSPKPKRKQDTLDFSPGKNVIGCNLLEFVIGNTSFSYERIVFQGNIGIKIPFAFTTIKNPQIDNFQKAWATGVDFDYYPRKPKRVNFFVGPSLETGQYKKERYYGYTNSQNGYTNSQYNTANDIVTDYYNYTIISVNSGFVVHLTSKINTSIYCGIPVFGNFSSRIRFGYNLGFHF